MEEKAKVTEEVTAIEKGEATPEQVKEIELGKYYTIPQIAKSLNFSRQRIWILIKEGRIKGAKLLGGHWRIAHSEYERLCRGIPPLPREKPSEATAIPVEGKSRERMVSKKEAKAKEIRPWTLLDLFTKE